jgi:hypothetical protein
MDDLFLVLSKRQSFIDDRRSSSSIESNDEWFLRWSGATLSVGDAKIDMRGMPWSPAVSNILSPCPGRPKCAAEKSLITESTEPSCRCLAHAARPPWAPNIA